MRLPWCHSPPGVTSEADGMQPEIGSDMGSFSPTAGSHGRLDQNSALRKREVREHETGDPFQQVADCFFFFPCSFPVS